LDNRTFFFVLWSLCFCGFGISSVHAQNNDTVSVVKTNVRYQAPAFQYNREHSAHKASLYAAILPGLGQAYNKKYWKIPILYAGVAGVAYGISFNSNYYNLYKSAYRDFVIRDPGNKSYTRFIPAVLTEADVYGEYESWFQNTLDNKKQYYRRYRDLSYIGMISIYLLQIVDAAVDAHFYNFDISDDLSLSVFPAVMIPAPGEFSGVGLQCHFNF